ncbi:hypothetical protein GKZ68_00670 [Hymenobacter sp. BRD128]|uniref:hypothetical protein n=1 Tax=Hymenobacter sp. BRD128 TaxID=2675878 RepID=UPI0015664160|nr:hypothetical protein [Hymenobacter sp. BRD128]QKG55202.1 hypothetical protein GKZ68_00235 [Hymenobacter sp. BRD128]QKG55278.1 hypothetical protein GKZ68_00670 [Hymenobacter sp. BRD128]
MGQLTGAIQFSGTVGNVTVSKTGQVRLKPQSNKAMYATSATMQRTRENGSEFGRAAKAGKLLRESLRGLLLSASDSTLVARATQKMRYIIGMDDANDRGERVVDKDNALTELLGFNFNAGASIGQSLHAPYGIAQNGADVTLSLASLNPQTDIVAPQGATHFEVVLGVAALNFETGTYAVANVAAPLGAIALNSAAAARSVVASLPAAPGADDVVIGAVGINFYQQLNGKLYPLNNNASNPLAIEFVG